MLMVYIQMTNQSIKKFILNLKMNMFLRKIWNMIYLMHSITEVLQNIAHFLDRNNTIRDILLQYEPIMANVGKMEVTRLTNGNITDTLTSVDFQDFAKFCGKVIEICKR